MTVNTIELNKSLADKICKLIDDVRTSVIELAKLAAEIRSQHFDIEAGKYDAKFNTFWKNQSMETRFGKLQNFTKYALAGEAIDLVKAQFPEHEKQLPITLAALYEVSQLSKDEMELCLQDKYRRTELTLDRSKWSKPKKPSPLINPTVAASEIKSWRNNWRDPKQPNTDKRRLPLAEIKLHGSFFDFKDGKHSGVVSKEKVKEIVDLLMNLKNSIDEDIVRFDIHDAYLLESYDKRESNSIEKARLAAEAQAKKAEEDAKKKSSNTTKQFVLPSNISSQTDQLSYHCAL
jgi:hypothetical protein